MPVLLGYLSTSRGLPGLDVYARETLVVFSTLFTRVFNDLLPALLYSFFLFAQLSQNVSEIDL